MTEIYIQYKKKKIGVDGMRSEGVNEEYQLGLGIQAGYGAPILAHYFTERHPCYRDNLTYPSLLFSSLFSYITPLVNAIPFSQGATTTGPAQPESQSQIPTEP